ncbi:pH-response regulator protein palA/RIM20 isoform X2 [Tripterygium wilfordii]|uniref:pH-response regulator protein palA/RIM20 isoform X2 n=1 Tax=Tripterygium wilfordii TaxID=458696 RepID=A0A7J7DZW9_TRIWF|nr:programmed cell death 6-interacting protein isoform X2 [Tripterygium wilfordii]KAF5751940.1 pH-response regulator protein palA/RIM20 isoform X2 [Tripterygium wilfordii]
MMLSFSDPSKLKTKRVLHKLEQYLPLLENFISHVDLVSSNSHMVKWIPELKIRWSSALGSSSLFSLMGPKFFQIDNVRFELGMTLFFYGSILRERASEFLPSDLVQSAALFRKAAGIFHYLGHEVLPSFQATLSNDKPPEATPSLSAAMSLICLAEAQAATIRKAEERGSIGVLEKLHHGVAEFLAEATHALNSATGEHKALSSRLLEFLSSCKALHELQSQKYLAQGLKVDGRVGLAVGVLSEALINVKKNLPGEDSWRSIFRKEIDAVEDILRKFEHENEFVWHEKIPPRHELPLPQCCKLVRPEPYQPERWERELAFKI